MAACSPPREQPLCSQISVQLICVSSCTCLPASVGVNSVLILWRDEKRSKLLEYCEDINKDWNVINTQWKVRCALKYSVIYSSESSSFINITSTGCPTRYRTRHFFNNSNTNEDIATKQTHTTDTFLFIYHTTNVLLFKFLCNIFIGVKTIKEMLGSVASGTHCTFVHAFDLALRDFQNSVAVEIGFLYLQQYLTAIFTSSLLWQRRPLKCWFRDPKNDLSRDEILQYDTAPLPPPSACRTHQWLQLLEWELLDHSAYRPSDCCCWYC